MKKKPSYLPKQKKYKIFLIRGIILLLLLGFCLFENLHLVVTMYFYEDEQIPAAFDGYRIVQISDLHNASFGNGNRRLLKKIQELTPDIIVITGDLVDSSRTNIDKALYFVEKATAIAPVYYVTGNHEYWLSEEEREHLFQGITASGASILKDSAAEIVKDEDSLFLLGLDDNSLTNLMLQKSLIEESHGKMTILLAHEPQLIHTYSDAGAELVLSGHAHGGQFRFPFVGGIIAPDQGIFPAYTSGTYSEGHTTMVVSRGLGNSVIPVRLFNDPEIVCINLSHKQ